MRANNKGRSHIIFYADKIAHFSSTHKKFVTVATIWLQQAACAVTFDSAVTAYTAIAVDTATVAITIDSTTTITATTTTAAVVKQTSALTA